MSFLKKCMGLLVAFAMTLGMAAGAAVLPVQAEETGYTITLPEDAGKTHTYQIYQIFTGDISENLLVNVKWGVNAKVEGDAAVGSLVDAAVLKELNDINGKTDQEKLDVITRYVDFESEAFNETENVPAGYYLIRDEPGSLEGKDEAATTYIVKVVKDVALTAKSAKPSVDKTVEDNDDSTCTAGDNDGFGETADHAINESFRFKLEAVLPADADFADYETYKVIFHDTMSDGITFEQIESVMVGSTVLTENDYSCTAETAQAGGSWTLTIEDIKAYAEHLAAGTTITVIYRAHLNEDAVIGNIDDNKNTVHLEYSNNPNAEGTGKTTEDTVWVFTYDVNAVKVDGEEQGKKLSGAEFRLYRDADCTDEIALYNKDGVYYPVKDGEEQAVIVSQAETGAVTIKGLDAGTYYLKETKAPTGYNLLTSPIEVLIDAADHHENADAVSAETILSQASCNEGIEIVNHKGMVLPETGGIGTTIFYAAGSILMAGAAFFLLCSFKSRHGLKG